ncbi:DHA2 family multidrug resistance protein-like MFS transporter [Amycolatopsis lexingtonensis]|uniref:DHA2 family multidrug resistance protein-like MFS transporter n=2 Tax=Amycolatopsis lexingtonensis TaxID=218822 RepID=A0ABR9HRK4_9PSEU|nr:MFS transporter [Amycolatopsis lexingtonensis]MBE1493564.1 DHA2 family multidrug resistance protein-like MFS transporter [Amycolatopsis lexingtonensis]
MTTTRAPLHPSLSPRRRWAALGVLVGAVLLLAIDGTVLYLAVPSLTRELAPSATEILWIGDVYSLALAGLLVTAGNLADRFGRKKVLLLGTAAFGAASVLAAFAPTAGVLVVARLLLGVAGATIMPSTLSLIRTLFADPRERTRAIAIWSAGSGGGIALGPLLGGTLLEHYWWGSVFLINVPVVIAFLIAGAVLLPESRDPNPGRFDLLSAALSMVAIVPLVYAVKHAVSEGVDARVAVAAALGIAAGVLFIRRQRRTAGPLIDVDLFRNGAFSGAVLANFIAVFALMGLLFFFSQYLQLVRGFSPLRAGLAEMPATLASIVVVAAVGVVVRRLGQGRAVAAGLAVAALGLALVAVAEEAPQYWWLGLTLVPVGLGVGLALTLTVDSVLSAVPRDKAGSASAISETAYELGAALGIALLGSLVTVVYRAFLPAGAPGEVRESLASATAALDPASDLAQAARDAFTGAMQVTSLAAAAVTAVAALIAWRTIPSGKD